VAAWACTLQEGELLAFPTTTGAYYGPGKCKPLACLEWPEGTDLKSLKQDSLEAGAMPEVEQVRPLARMATGVRRLWNTRAQGVQPAVFVRNTRSLLFSLEEVHVTA